MFCLTTQYPERLASTPRRQFLEEWISYLFLQIRKLPNTIDLTIRFVSLAESMALNHQFRQKNYPTNVLTFVHHDDKKKLWADIVICNNIIYAEAYEQGKKIKHHYAHMVVHGCLHALGYTHDDEISAIEMENFERDILVYFSYPDPYGEEIL